MRSWEPSLPPKTSSERLASSQAASWPERDEFAEGDTARVDHRDGEYVFEKKAVAAKAAS